MDSGIESVAEVDNADKQLVKSIKSFLCEIRGPFPESRIEKISYTVYLTDPFPALKESLRLLTKKKIKSINNTVNGSVQMNST